MPDYIKFPLSGSVDGKRILITATASGSATPIHTVPAGSSSIDEVWLYAYNEATSSVLLSILWGGTVEPNDVNRVLVSSQAGKTLIVDGQILQNGLTIRAYASASNVINVDGFINRIQ